MYELDILNGIKWTYLCDNDSLCYIDRIIKNICNSGVNKNLRILENDKVLVILDGTIEQYNWFHKNYVEKMYKEKVKIRKII